ncbi:MAG: class II aldolase/adducin family protein [Chloroflexi bacterium]|nr:class II aldolase/adducin family protein [Chloroflexota bacterium]
MSVSNAALSVAIAGESQGRLRTWFLNGLRQVMTRRGYRFSEKASPGVRLVLNFIKTRRPRPFRRHSKATFVVSVAEAEQRPENVLKEGYPLLVRALSNLLVYIFQSQQGPQVHFVTMEQGCYKIPYDGDEEAFFDMVYERLAPLAASQLMIDNEFTPDLPASLWQGDAVTGQIGLAGKQLDRLGLLPAPFPLEEIVPERELRHIKLLYGIGGLSYGNISARAADRSSFWMSASGVNKSDLHEIGRDILLIRGYDLDRQVIIVSVPPDVRPRRASVDAIEHALIYEEHPSIRAIVHIHAWMEGVRSTQVNYPCGTYELAQAVSQLVREAPVPSQAVIGLKNHGLTITGLSLENIFARIEGKVIPQVPMS